MNGLWIQDTNVGLWLQYGNSNCTVENSVIESTDADGVNFNGNATNCTVKNNFIRGTGDDSLAIWSYPALDSDITFANNTIVAPTLANGIADYGGSNNTISNNVVADDNALGSGIDISNEQFLQPGFVPLTGTINVTGNYLIRAGAYNPNWVHPMGAVQFDAYDTPFTGVTVNYSGGAILDSPYEAFELVSGDGEGNAISGLNISDVNVQNVGTTVMQAETSGSASVSGVTASGVGVAGAYNYAYPSDTAGAFTFNLGSGNSGWSTTPVLTAYPNPVQAGSLTDSSSVLSFGDVASGATSSSQAVTITNPGPNAASVSSVSVSGPFSQTNTCGTSIAAGSSCTANVTFAPTSGGPLTGSLSVASSAPGSPLTISLTGTGVTPTTDLALGQPATASSYEDTFTASNVTDGDTTSYWESSDGAAYPQTVAVNLGSVQSIGSLTLDLPPSTAWATRSETLSVLGSTNGTTFSQIVGSATYTFNPATGNTVTISLPSGTSAQYVELSFTANTGWSAAQLSELEVFPGTGGGGTSPGSALTASPSSLSFASTTVGSASAAQTVTVSNPNTSAVPVSSVSASGPFSQTNTCGSSIAAGGSCTASVTFSPTATGSAAGTLSVASSATGSPLTVALSGTGASATGSALTASPSSVSFASTTVGSASAAQTVTVSNPNTSAVSVSSVSASGPFSQTNTCGSSIAAGGSCTASVTFTPTATGSAAGTLSVASNAAGSPLAVALSGTGASATGNALTASPSSVAFASTTVGSASAAQTVTVSNPNTSAVSVSSVSASGPFSQTNTCGSSIAAGGSCTASVTFTPTATGSAAGTLSVASNAAGSPLTVALSGTGTASSNTNLALNQPVTASSDYEAYVPANVTDGNTSSYWESADGAAYPQTLTVNLGSVQSIGSVTLDLPPAAAWATRTETLSVLGSANDTTFSQIVGSAGYTFNPATGNTVTISLPSGTSAQYVQLSFTANTGWTAAQLSEFEVFSGGGSTGGSSALTASPSSVSFASTVTGSTSPSQTITVTNPGTSAATVSSVAVTGPFSQASTCGTSIAAGGSCTVTVKFTPTATGAASGTLSVASTATGSPLTVALSGTGVSSTTDLALNAPVTASSYTQTYTPSNAVDGNTSTYWEATNGAWPATYTVNLGSVQALGSITIDLPPSTAWSTRTQTLSVLGSANDTTFSTLVASATYTWNPSTGNTVTIPLPAGTTDQYVELSFTANSVQNGAQASEVLIYP